MTIRSAALFFGLLLLLGLATTVGVAWVFAGVDPRAFEGGDHSTSSSGNGWELHVSQSAVHWSGSFHPVAGDEPPYEEMPFDPPRWSIGHEPAPDGIREINEEARGWPWHSLRCVFVEDDNLYRAPADLVSGGVLIRPLVARPQRWWQYHWNAIPLTPIWGGLLGSTLYYALCWLVMVAIATAPASVRRALRRSVERCVHCGYARIGAAGERCPECGRDATRRPPLLSGGRIAAAGIFASIVVAADIAWFALLVTRYERIEPIHVAAGANDVAALNQLIAERADVNAVLDGPDVPFFLDGTTPLTWAAASGSDDPAAAAMNRLLREAARSRQPPENGLPDE